MTDAFKRGYDSFLQTKSAEDNVPTYGLGGAALGGALGYLLGDKKNKLRDALYMAALGGLGGAGAGLYENQKATANGVAGLAKATSMNSSAINDVVDMVASLHPDKIKINP